MNIIFVGVPTSEEKLKEINDKYYAGVSQVRPQQYFDYKLIKGLSNTVSLYAVSMQPIQSFPNTKTLVIKSDIEIPKENLKIKYLGVLNVPVLKSIVYFVKVFSEVFKARKNKPVVLFGYLSPFTNLLNYLIQKVLKLETVLVVPDLPEYVTSYSKSYKLRGKVYTLFVNMLKKLTYSYDKYIILTKHMNEKVNKLNKPSLVIEGMVDDSELFEINNVDTSRKKEKRIVMYAGSLHENFGIKKLVSAFLKISNPSIELWIFGSGDFQHELEDISAQNPQIKFMGTKPKVEILKHEVEVDLLVNPRPTSEDYTKYSFPSKTLEYMLSGTPLLTTKLEGIPDEFNEYLYIFEKEDEETIAKQLEEVVFKDKAVLSLKGSKARSYVIKNKHIDVQAKKILMFLEL